MKVVMSSFIFLIVDLLGGALLAEMIEHRLERYPITLSHGSKSTLAVILQVAHLAERLSGAASTSVVRHCPPCEKHLVHS